MLSQDYQAFMERIYHYEVPTIRQVQDYVNENDLSHRMQMISRIGDPSLAFTLYFPIVVGINFRSGIRFLGAAILCEWMNQVLKWILFGERPYWWIPEAELFSSNPRSSLILLEQNRMTCETGPGLPSGHVMINLVIWLIMADTISGKILSKLNETSPIRIFVNRLVWFGFITMQLMVSGSRIYNLNHFPHQCISAFVCGIVVIKLAYHSQEWLTTHSRLTCLIKSLLFTISALGVYQGLLAQGINPDWSIAKALKWCKHQEWIYIDTTPFYALVRYSGAAFGLGCILPKAKVQRELNQSELYCWSDQGLRIALGIVWGMVSTLMHMMMPRKDLNIFYALEFLLNAFSIVFIAYFVPRISDLVFKRNLNIAEDKQRKLAKNKKSE